jgi:hypothetical protein
MPRARFLGEDAGGGDAVAVEDHEHPARVVGDAPGDRLSQVRRHAQRAEIPVKA